jgi:hypothetical protein
MKKMWYVLIFVFLACEEQYNVTANGTVEIQKDSHPKCTSCNYADECETILVVQSGTVMKVVDHGYGKDYMYFKVEIGDITGYVFSDDRVKGFRYDK